MKYCALIAKLKTALAVHYVKMKTSLTQKICTKCVKMKVLEGMARTSEELIIMWLQMNLLATSLLNCSQRKAVTNKLVV